MLFVPCLSYCFSRFEWEWFTPMRDYCAVTLSNPCRQSHLRQYLYTSTTGIVTSQSGWSVNRLDMERFAAFKASLPEVSKGDWGNLVGKHTHINVHTSVHESFLVLCTLHPVSIRSFPEKKNPCRKCSYFFPAVRLCLCKKTKKTKNKQEQLLLEHQI